MSLTLALTVVGLVLFSGLSFVAPSTPKWSRPNGLGHPESFESFEHATEPVYGTHSQKSQIPMYGLAILATAAAGVLARVKRNPKVARHESHGIKFSYSMQKDAYADLEFLNDVGCLEFLGLAVADVAFGF